MNNDYFVAMDIQDGDWVVTHRCVRSAKSPEEAAQMSKDGQSYGDSDYRDFRLLRVEKLTKAESKILRKFLQY